jgi:hypothetical protein
MFPSVAIYEQKSSQMKINIEFVPKMYGQVMIYKYKHIFFSFVIGLLATIHELKCWKRAIQRLLFPPHKTPIIIFITKNSVEERKKYFCFLNGLSEYIYGWLDVLVSSLHARFRGSGGR